MNFENALTALKAGKFLTRVGWGTALVYLVKKEGLATRTKDGKLATMAHRPYFSLRSAKAETLPGWTPRASDLLAEDWEIIDLEDV
ncbi:DUF2829 domain-containing protein [Acidisoma sp. S159]|uniref:DUF2829 domain-containing protein n=1 Tax=Acidisoma sp. S159 TaxID=1747225 RepID=UPI00131ACA0C|nr:DUF2829 domain-containing protein [Acidisoma sp. S159]